ncbi:MAG TPA: DUF3307 domain-containing protein [Alphaproteobacteria bacterium]|nr:DUF3307 domain-containing protein [Alphaproteobacteria bacterium]HAJ47805.1 DUF3307 domain-containing protein [Alphaproteobacteria bacterium]
MLETFIVLIAAHIVADFLLQTNEMVRDKKQPDVMALHIVIVVFAAWAMMGTNTRHAFAALAFLGLTHLALDLWKLYYGGPGLKPFAIDQAGHIAVIAVIAAVYPAMYADGMWARSYQWLPYAHSVVVKENYLKALILIAGTIATLRTGGIVIGLFTRTINFQGNAGGLEEGGAYIGLFERMLVLMFVLMGHPEGIGFLIAAKSILRFQAADERKMSEYIIIGTLASFAWAIASSLLTKAALDAV